MEIPNYIREVELSKKRRPIYYKEGTSIPKKYSNKENYDFSGGYLINKSTGEKVVKNANVYNKPRYKKIQGQDIWRGVNFHLRSKISKEMKKYFYEHFRGIPKIVKYPIGIRIDFYDNVEEGEDLDNMIYFYRKCIHDALCGNVEFIKVSVDKIDKNVEEMIPNREKYPQIIVDDGKKYVQAILTQFYPIDVTKETPRLVLEIYEI